MARAPQAEGGAICPLFRKDTASVCHKCAWYIQVRGQHPQTKQEIDNWVCSIAFTPIAVMDAARQERSTTAAVEQMRNEVAANSSRDRSQELTACLAVLGKEIAGQKSIAQPEQKLISG